MDTPHSLIEIAEFFTGTVDGAAVYPRVVLAQALEKNAADVVLFHNHRSDVAEPSEADRFSTRKLVRALSLVDIRLLDRLVVTDGNSVSLAERG